MFRAVGMWYIVRQTATLENYFALTSVILPVGLNKPPIHLEHTHTFMAHAWYIEQEVCNLKAHGTWHRRISVRLGRKNNKSLSQ